MRIETVLIVLVVALMGCESTGPQSANVTAQDAGVTDATILELGPALTVDAFAPPPCECASDGDCVSSSLILGPCQQATCDVSNCTCVILDSKEGTECDDDDKCTLGTVCNGGSCVGGEELVCNDGNPCTDDECYSADGCKYEYNSRPCDDGNACKVNDTCIEGDCISTESKICDDSNDCTLNGCNEVIGCTFDAHGGSCNDGSKCTETGTCIEGICVPGPEIDCDDGNPCTLDICGASVGCLYSPGDGPCDDGNFCSLEDQCSGGSCSGTVPNTCDDGDACTEDSCQGDACLHAQVVCEDDNLCTANVCIPETGCDYPLIECTSEGLCYDGVCEPDVGCQSVPNTAPCDDGSACSLMDQCQEGECVGVLEQNCDDGNSCTLDSCDDVTGCIQLPIAGQPVCDDGNPCTLFDACETGQCVGGSFALCSDGNPCTDDYCDVAEGCVYEPNLHPCDDGLQCTTGSMCADGTCQGGIDFPCDDGEPCTADNCIEGLGCVTSALTGTSCDDGLACNGDEFCVSGACIIQPCICSTDADCAGESPCEGQVSCSGGICNFTDPVICEDLGPCISHVCDVNTGECEQEPLLDGQDCDDGNLCTGADQCVSGTCEGSLIECDDGNPCTLDTCEPDGDCSYSPLSDTSCPLGECQSEGTCQMGACIQTDAECIWNCGVAEKLTCGQVIRERALEGTSFFQGVTCSDEDFMGPEALYTWTSDSTQQISLSFQGETGTEVLLLSTEGEEECEEGLCDKVLPGITLRTVNEGETIRFRVDSAYPTGGTFSLGLRCESTLPLTTCELSGEVGCPSCSCEECVCAENPTCCTEEWTAFCSLLCENSCGGCGVEEPCEPTTFPGMVGQGECVDCVCEADPLCCEVTWDGICVIAGQTSCEESCGCSFSEGSCCEAHGGKGCDMPACASCVCAKESSCCDWIWDAGCAALTTDACVDVCPCADPTQTCCAPHAEASCEDNTCSACICEQAPHCCEVSWDGSCVALATSGLCSESCPCSQP